MQRRYRMILARRSAKVEDDALQRFVVDLMRGFGGSDLVSRCSVVCKDNDVFVEADEDAMDIFHGSLFFCGEYRSVKCKFEIQ